MNRLTRHALDQFRRPRGPLGMLAGAIMSRRGSNIERSRWTIDVLDLAAGARVLELGYGPGPGIDAFFDRVPDGQLVGIDHSDLMHAMATRRHRSQVDAGTLDLRVGDAEHPPDDLGQFDAIFSCNVWPFWADPVGTITRLGRNLRPGGAFAITNLPRRGEPGRQLTDQAADLIEDHLTRAGLTDVTRRYLDLEPTPAVCVIGRRPR